MVKHAEPNFAAQLAAYKQAIDDDIAAYAAYVRAGTQAQYGEYVALEVNTFLDILERGGKRIRGALVMAGYEMCGGANRPMAIQAARAIEMMHAYLLILDDIQDRSKLRRGELTAHELFARYHKSHRWSGDAAHTGTSLAINAAIAGCHAAQTVMANLDADPQLRLNALSITNRTLGITAHGQTQDIVNELVKAPRPADIERVLEWKTALYTVINPLHVGMVLAGADCHATDAITPFGQHAGKAFQIIDDILGVFGDAKELGKAPGDDIREGKGTLLVLYALERAKSADRTFLRACLGNPKLTDDDFARCRHIIEMSGALAAVRVEAEERIALALQALDAAAGRGLWNDAGSAFLRGFTQALQHRLP
jgi:geranylgeranyl diphosphate synthase, type I